MNAISSHRIPGRTILFSILLLAFLIGGAAVSRAAEVYREQWRPQFHFTPAVNWMNDPNGMVYYEGEYHLFYQYNPFGIQWGHMSWGHAVSRDLVRWEHLPLALAEENGVMIFSGSAVVDWKNTSGFGRDGKPPMIAIYTGHHTGKPLQNQHIAYSNDKGRTWTKYTGNPVLDLNMADFRDPKVFWHEASARWIMTAALAKEKKVHFYASPDLKQWKYVGEFGPAGSASGLWECPDLFPLRVAGGGAKWVLVVNINPGGPAGGSGCQYFVGEFDGAKFTPDARDGAGRPLWADFGPDFYAGVSWSDVPKRDGRRLWLGWMSNWSYANDVPTTPWRSAMSIPRALALRKTEAGFRLLQEPVRELRSLRGKGDSVMVRNVRAPGVVGLFSSVTGDVFEVEGLLQPTADAVFDLRLKTGATEETVLHFDLPSQSLTLDRSRSGNVAFHQNFMGKATGPIRLVDGRIKLRLFVDVSSLEIFVNDGETVLTALILPTAGERKLELVPSKGEIRRARLSGWKLNSAWSGGQ